MDCALNYFVAGLPRSCTAWLSVFLSQSGHYCHHEAVNGCKSLKEYVDKVGSSGDSSTGLMYIPIKKIFPQAPIVIIHKNKQQFDRLIEWGVDTFGEDTREEMYHGEQILKTIDGLHVEQSDLFDRLPEIFKHLTNKECKEKFLKLKELNIQSDPYKIDIEAAEIFLNDTIQQNS